VTSVWQRPLQGSDLRPHAIHNRVRARRSIYVVAPAPAAPLRAARRPPRSTCEGEDGVARVTTVWASPFSGSRPVYWLAPQ